MSRTPGSVNEPDDVKVPPAVIAASGPALTVGATFRTVTAVVIVVSGVGWDSHARKASLRPALVRLSCAGPGAKSAVPQNEPATSRRPSVPAEIVAGSSRSVPPRLPAQTSLPAGL